MAKPILIIDPGHGGADQGADGIKDDGVIEKDYTLMISLYQFERFKELGVPVALTRSTDETLDEDKRTAIVRASGAEYCISNHLNSAGSADAAGAEVIHSVHSDGKLAHALVYAIRDAGQILRRTPVFSKQLASGSDYYYMHRETGSVSTNIVEYGFISNAADVKRIKANWKTYAEAVVRAFCSFIGHAYQAPDTAPAKPQEPTGMFKDVPDNHPARTSIEKAAAKGIINGIAPGVFGLGQPLTREQQAVMLDRLGLLD
jgi:N-acetylmuramoyl-L-alanine amidase